MIFLTEYDEKKHLRNVYKDGKEAGLAEGMTKGITMMLIQLVCKKLDKGKTVEAIANDLEEDMATVEEICRAAKTVSNHDCDRIYEILCKKE